MGTAISDGVKRISITSKRQMTIPQAFFMQLGFGTEAECMIKDNQLIVKPVREGLHGEFDEEILEDLISQGYTGKELLDKFKEYRKQVRPAVEAMLNDAHLAAKGEGKIYTDEDVFGKEA